MPFWRHICLLWCVFPPPPTPTPEGLNKSVSSASARAWHHQDWPQASWGALGEGEGWAAVHTGPQRWGFWQFAVGFWRIPDPPSGRAIPSDGCVASKSSCTVSILTHDSSWVSLAWLPVQIRTGLHTLPFILWPTVGEAWWFWICCKACNPFFFCFFFFPDF